MIENSLELQERFQTFEQDRHKIVLTIVIDTRITHQRLHIPFLRQLIDRTDRACKASADLPAKYFLVLMHSFGQELDPRSCFPSIFLHEWDYWFIDTCTPSSAFHFQKLLPILSADMNKYNEEEVLDNMIFDFDNLFDDCLWDFCARLKVTTQRISTEMFANDDLFQFYRHQTTVTQRVKCLQTILLGANQLQTRIVTIYHENVSMKSEFRQKNRNSIYEICKNTLCGKQFAGVIEALQSQIRTSFTNFVANVLKFIVDDYGLEAIVKSSRNRQGLPSLVRTDRLFVVCHQC